MNIFDVMPEHVLTSQNTSEIVDFALNIIKGVKFVFYDDFVITDINNHKSIYSRVNGWTLTTTKVCIPGLTD